MLRDPVKNFESGFGFFRDYPWPQWLGEKNRKVEDFLDNADKIYDKNTCYKRASSGLVASKII